MTFLINGATASLAPMSQQWIDLPLHTNLAGKTIYSPRKNIRLEFDTCSLAHYQQWEDVVNGGSLTSLTVLQQDALAYSAYSGVYLDFDQRPAVQAGLAVGPWSILVREVTP